MDHLHAIPTILLCHTTLFVYSFSHLHKLIFSWLFLLPSSCLCLKTLITLVLLSKKMSTSSCSFWVKPLTPFPAEAWPINVMTLISGAWRFNMAAISCTLSRNDEKIITRVLTSWGPEPGHRGDRRETDWIKNSFSNPELNSFCTFMTV